MGEAGSGQRKRPEFLQAPNWEQVWGGASTGSRPRGLRLRASHRILSCDVDISQLSAMRNRLRAPSPGAHSAGGGRTRSSGRGWGVGSGGGGAQVTRPCPAPTPAFPPQNPTSFIMTSPKRPRVSWAFNKLLPKEWEQLQRELLGRVRAPFIVKPEENQDFSSQVSLYSRPRVFGAVKGSCRWGRSRRWWRRLGSV